MRSITSLKKNNHHQFSNNKIAVETYNNQQTRPKIDEERSLEKDFNKVNNKSSLRILFSSSKRQPSKATTKDIFDGSNEVNTNMQKHNMHDE